MKVGFIGTGNMGGALAHAAAQSPAPAELLLSNRTPEKAQALAQQLGATVSDNETIAQTCDYIFLGVKPQMMADLLARLRPILSRRQEGFTVLAEKFRQVGRIEKAHEERYRALLNNVEMQRVFEKSEETMWECRNCGHLVIGKKAPEVCPVCAHPQSYFEVRKENY